MALKIVMFSDFICPFCYIGFDVIRKLKSDPLPIKATPLKRQKNPGSKAPNRTWYHE